MNAVSVQGASKVFFEKKKKIRALDRVSFDISQGEIFGLLGPNGAGKTTLISAMCGLIELDGGSVKVLGFDAQTEREKVISKINLVTGFAGVLRGLSVRDLLKYYAYLYCLPDKDREIKRVLDLTGLADKADQPGHTLSSGFRQRFYIAKALLTNPEVLLMDEPTVGLDVEMSLRIRDLIRNLKKQGITILLTTHYMLEAEQLCDRVALINEGKIVALGSVPELKHLAGKPHASLEDTFLALTHKPLEEENDE